MKNNRELTPETLLIDTYKHIDAARNQVEQLIDLIGSRQAFVHHPLPDDVQQLVEISLRLPPEKRKILQRFIESLVQE